MLKIENVQVDIFGKKILKGINLEIKKQEQWVIYGAAGSGKTILAHVLEGRQSYQGSVELNGDRDDFTGRIGIVELQHRFKNIQNTSDFYYQQRYHSFDAEATVTVDQYLSTMESLKPGEIGKADLLNLFHLQSLQNESLIQLSNGENKRLQLLKAILRCDELLILDEPYTGLDQEGRNLLDEVLNELSVRGFQFILLTSRMHWASCFHKFARLENGLLYQEDSLSFLSNPVISNPVSVKKSFPDRISFDYPDFKTAVRMRNVCVKYGEKNILNGINWEVEKGSCWALTGNNGAGKSTLLSLITADNPQAYSNEIYLFDRRRGTGESIWEIKRKIGFLSPELQLYFDPSATAFSALASGLFDTIGLFRTVNPEQESYINDWLNFLGCESYKHRPLINLPAGINRLILLGRALLRKAPLLILDEPAQGLDETQRNFIIGLVDDYCHSFDASLIYTSHYEEEFPGCITRKLVLKKGISI